jgi:hypothetical protein
MKIYESLSSRLKSQHESIPVIISGAVDKIHLIPQPGKWSIHDNIAHLAKYQPVFLERMNVILKTNEPVFERYTAEEDPQFEEWRRRKTNQLISEMNNDRDIINKLIFGLSEIELNRIGIHKKYGRLNILQWCEFFLLHEAHHIFTIFQLTNNTETK